MISSNLFIKLRLLPLWKLFSKLEIFCCLLLTGKFSSTLLSGKLLPDWKLASGWKFSSREEFFCQELFDGKFFAIEFSGVVLIPCNWLNFYVAPRVSSARISSLILSGGSAPCFSISSKIFATSLSTNRLRSAIKSASSSSFVGAHST